MELPVLEREKLNRALSTSGLRATKQREIVYAVVHEHGEHPTADEVYALAKRELEGISLATVYNCLESLVECNLLREVNFGRRSTRFELCNPEHAHFYCVDRDEVHDIDIPQETLQSIKDILPEGFNMESFTIKFSGTCSCHHEDKHQDTCKS